MEPVTLVVTALVAGATAGISGTVAAAVADAYEGLKTLVMGCFQRGGVPDETSRVLVADAGSNAGKALLSEELAAVEIDAPTVEAAHQLLELLEQGGKFHVDASQAKGLYVGDHGHQTNNFH